MLEYQRNAINAVKEYAKIRIAEHQAYVEKICRQFNVDVQTLICQVLRNPVTINFHPDRFSNNGKTVIENLIEQGQYHGQFRTGTSNGGMSAYAGGDRYLWEQRLFSGAYPDGATDRPKYGALNLFRYVDGASVRFGSCFFVLKHDVINRCTFAYGDSSSNPTTLCTSDAFIGVLVGIFEDIKRNGRLLNRVVSSEREALAILLNPCAEVKDIGKNLDYCIETHIHGDVLLGEDAEKLYIDESFKYTSFERQAKELCQKCGITLCWIPQRQVDVETIGELFRGPKIPILARKIDNLFGHNQGIINASLIGQASRDSSLHPEAWRDIGNESEVFQYLKQLWHTVGYFG